MLDGAPISLDVTVTQVTQAVDMVRMPVTEVFDRRLAFLYLAEHALLIGAVLFEIRGGALRGGAWLNDAVHWYTVRVLPATFIRT